MPFTLEQQIDVLTELKAEIDKLLLKTDPEERRQHVIDLIQWLGIKHIMHPDQLSQRPELEAEARRMVIQELLERFSFSEFQSLFPEVLTPSTTPVTITGEMINPEGVGVPPAWGVVSGRPPRNILSDIPKIPARIRLCYATYSAVLSSVLTRDTMYCS